MVRIAKQALKQIRRVSILYVRPNLRFENYQHEERAPAVDLSGRFECRGVCGYTVVPFLGGAVCLESRAFYLNRSQE